MLKTPCTLWKGPIDAQGYGRARGPKHSRQYRAHRVVWEQANGPLNNLTLDHLCPNKHCVELTHLEPVSNEENARRAAHARTQRPQCKQGHAWTPETTAIRRDAYGFTYRQCRTCQKERMARFRTRQRANR